MSDIVIVGAKRTAIGSFLGQFTGVPTPTLGATAIKAALEQAAVAPSDVNEVIMGCVLPANLGQAPARQAAPHHAFASVAAHLRIVASDLDTDAPILGGAWLARQQVQ